MQLPAAERSDEGRVTVHTRIHAQSRVRHARPSAVLFALCPL